MTTINFGTYVSTASTANTTLNVTSATVRVLEMRDSRHRTYQVWCCLGAQGQTSYLPGNVRLKEVGQVVKLNGDTGYVRICRAGTLGSRLLINAYERDQGITVTRLELEGRLDGSTFCVEQGKVLGLFDASDLFRDQGFRYLKGTLNTVRQFINPKPSVPSQKFFNRVEAALDRWQETKTFDREEFATLAVKCPKRFVERLGFLVEFNNAARITDFHLDALDNERGVRYLLQVGRNYFNRGCTTQESANAIRELELAARAKLLRLNSEAELKDNGFRPSEDPLNYRADINNYDDQ